MSNPAATNETPDASAAEEALVKLWSARIQRAKRGMEDTYKEWKELREYTSGEALKKYDVRTNLVAATMGTLVPHIYARNPEVSVRPAPAVDQARYQVMQGFARTAEGFVDKQLRDGEFKDQAKRCVRSALTIGVGWMKVNLQIRTGGQAQPDIQHEIEDIQQEIKVLSELQEEIKTAENTESREAKIAQRTDTLRALEAKRDAVIAKGFTFEPQKGEDMLIDPDLLEVVDYRFGKWVAQGLWIRPDDQEQLAEYNLTPTELGGATVYASRDNTDTEGEGSSRMAPTAPSADGGATGNGTWLRAWEIWDKEHGTVYTYIEGMNRWARAPFAPEFAGRRFFPFFLLGFNFIDSQFMPEPDVSLWTGLQDEYCRTRSAYSVARRRSIPARVVDSAVTKGDDAIAEKLKKPEINELVVLELNGAPLDAVLGNLPYPTVDMALYNTQPILADLEFVSGMQDALRGATPQPKTATEANIQQSGTITRLSAKNDSIEDWVREIGIYMLEMSLEAFTTAEVQRYMGQGAAWPQLSQPEIYSLVELNIQGGSSGKPNKLAHQQAWAVLLPQVQQLAMQIGQFRARALAAALQAQMPAAPPAPVPGAVPGAAPALPPVPQQPNPVAMLPVQIMTAIADALEEILRESFRRADERLDPDEFIPNIQIPGDINGSAINPSVIAGLENLYGPGFGLANAGPGPKITPGQDNPGNLGA